MRFMEIEMIGKNFLIFSLFCTAMAAKPMIEYKDDMKIIYSKLKNQGEKNSKLSIEMKIKLLGKHNEARSKTSNSSADMVELGWSNVLENVAQQWSDKCTIDYGPSNVLPHMGQNIYCHTKVNPGVIEGAFQSWISEKEHFNYSSNSCVPFICSNYTAIIWSSTQFVGCAKSDCSLHGCNEMLVCNYFPKGNIPGIKPYQQGKVCSKCPSKCNINLCEGNNLRIKNELNDRIGPYVGKNTGTSKEMLSSSTLDTMSSEKPKGYVSNICGELKIYRIMLIILPLTVLGVM